MKLKVKSLKLAAGHPVAILHQHTAQILSVFVSERVRIRKKHSIVAIVDIAEGILKKGEVALSIEVMKALNIRENEIIEVTEEPAPKSTRYILEKLDGKTLNYNKIFTLVGDIVHNALTEDELAFFVSGVYTHGMTDKEVADMVGAMVHFGKKLNIKGEIYDKHCIGGIAGNRTTPLVVAICSAAGLKIPKTSSRAITSAAGTADTIEVLADVEFSIEEMKRIVNKTNACLVWGGSLGLAPADDKIIRIERHLALDPKSQLIASILAKKLSVGSKGILIDIPYGSSAKVKTKSEAKKLGKRFKKISKLLNIKLDYLLTDGSQPIGSGVGPVLEMIDILKVLRQDKNRPMDLEKRSIILASKLLEIAGRKNSEEKAEEILKTGKAYKKFAEIIKAQNGNITKFIKPADLSYNVLAKRSGKIKEISNKKIASVARMAGCPAAKKAGIFLYKHVGDKVKEKEKLITIYSLTKQELEQAKKLFNEIKPVVLK